MRKFSIFILVILVSNFVSSLVGVHAAENESPRLILLVVVDQLRGDMIERHADRLGPDGFVYLVENGTVYTQANFSHATTLTAVGHAAIATGAPAAAHGIAGNNWIDRTTNRSVYCVEDAESPVLGENVLSDNGFSPANLQSETFGDAWVLASGGKGRVFSVSGKDRGAILPGGYTGKAFWYSKKSGNMITSTYYYDVFPDWASQWNAAAKVETYRDAKWMLSRNPENYRFLQSDDRAEEKSYKTLGRTFDHLLAHEEDAAYFSQVRFTPMFDDLVLDFAKTLVRSEGVGNGPVTDILSISLSATDYIGHAFGPNSLEAEDNFFRLDAALADWFQFIDEEVGLENTLIILTSDHGVDYIPEYASTKGVPAGRLNMPQIIRELNAALKTQFDTDADLISDQFWNPSIFLDENLIVQLGFDAAKIERHTAMELKKLEGIALAITRGDLLSGDIGSDAMHQRVIRAFHPERSGNIFIVQEPHWYLYNDHEKFAAMHGSPYGYDTHVPLIFAGMEIEPQVIDRPVAPESVAATVAAFLGVSPPASADAPALVEVLE